MTLEIPPVDHAVSPEFGAIKKVLDEFNLDSLRDPLRAKAYAEHFGLDQLFASLEVDTEESQSSALLRNVSESEHKPFEPEYADLCRLHWLCLSRKTLNVLEFGSGFSTVAIADAMRILDTHFGAWAAENTRVEKPFHVFAVEESERFAGITRDRLGDELGVFATVSQSSVEVYDYDHRICTVYSSLPNISPDLVYLDGPSQFATTETVNGFSFDSVARMPMVADLLRFEFFLEPGTLILVDGRTANVRFLKAYFKRNWVHMHDPEGDVHYLELQEAPLGPFNRVKMDFCLNGKWLLS